eukprot:6337599-Lingulodinium_polyedra.AAC.1
MPKATGRIEGEREKARKKAAEHDQAMAKYDSMDIKALLACAVSEVHNSKHRSSNFQRSGVMQHLLSTQPELKEELLKAMKAKEPRSSRSSTR